MQIELPVTMVTKEVNYMSLSSTTYDLRGLNLHPKAKAPPKPLAHEQAYYIHTNLIVSYHQGGIQRAEIMIGGRHDSLQVSAVRFKP